MIGIRPKQLIEPEYHDYPENEQDRIQMRHGHAMYVNQYDLIQKQIRADAILLRQLQEEEREQFLKQSS